MNIVVMKFGGSSVADTEAMRRVAAQVVERKRQGKKVVVVVSAMGKTTDQLIAKAREISDNPPRRELDMLVTAGERISMALLGMAIDSLGEKAMSFTGSQSGIITEDSHQGARVLEVRPQRLHDALAEDRVVIVAGFQGMSLRREVTTLGRGGSDTTAVALAAALEAEACEIYSDVDGVYSADPRICPQAGLLREVGYEVMQTMAGAGAKVLNAQAVEFARRAGIVIHARKTGDTSGRETLVRAGPAAAGLLAVVGHKLLSRIDGAAAAWGELDRALAPIGVRWVIASLSGARLDGLVDRTDVAGQDATLVTAAAQRVGFAATPVATATLVGANLDVQLLGRAHTALATAGVGTEGVFVADLACRFVVPVASCDRAVAVLHEALLGA